MNAPTTEGEIAMTIIICADHHIEIDANATSELISALYFDHADCEVN